MEAFAILFYVVPIIIVGGFILAGVALTRRDADTDRRRSYAVYLLAGTFAGLVITIGGATAVAGDLVRLAQDTQPVEDPESFTTFYLEEGAAEPGAVARDGLILAVGVLLLRFHGKRALELSRSDGVERGSLALTFSTYAYMACFGAALTSLTAGAMALFAALRIIAPGTFGNLPELIERDLAVGTFFQMFVLAVATGLLFRWHWSAAERLRNATGSSG